LQLNISNAPFDGWNIQSMDETCLGAGDGMISINDIRGGVGQIDVTVDGDIRRDLEFSDLRPDIYEFIARDALGCTQDTLIDILEGGDINVDLGDDLRIESGEEVCLIPEISGDVAASTSWEISTAASESIMIDTLCIRPLSDQQIIVSVTSETGCIATDTILIEVFINIDNIGLFVPSIINRSSILGNDQATITLRPDIIEVRDFAIFDRWGQLIMYTDLLTPGDVATWDGTFRQQDVASGVYVYTYEMLTIYDDVRRRRSGDITVID